MAKHRNLERGLIKPGYEPSEDEGMSWYRNYREGRKVKDLFDGANAILRKTEDGIIERPAIKIQVAMHWGLAKAYSTFDQLMIMGFLEPYEEDEKFDTRKWVEEYRKGYYIERKQKSKYRVLFSKKSQIRKMINKYIDENPDCWLGEVGSD